MTKSGFPFDWVLGAALKPSWWEYVAAMFSGAAAVSDSGRRKVNLQNNVMLFLYFEPVSTATSNRRVLCASVALDGPYRDTKREP